MGVGAQSRTHSFAAQCIRESPTATSAPPARCRPHPPPALQARPPWPGTALRARSNARSRTRTPIDFYNPELLIFTIGSLFCLYGSVCNQKYCDKQGKRTTKPAGAVAGRRRAGTDALGLRARAGKRQRATRRAKPACGRRAPSSCPTPTRGGGIISLVSPGPGSSGRAPLAGAGGTRKGG